MWIFTKDGFFSAVKDDYCGEDEVTVRARNIEHLRAMLNRTYGPKTKLKDLILKTKQADYRYRFKMSKHDWTVYVALSAKEIDYATVKNNVGAKGDLLFKEALLDVWYAMNLYQGKINGK